MAKIVINDQEFEVKDGITVLEAALQNGIFIPHFCYHPHLAISGNCRMCLVEIEKMPKLQISCATTVQDGMKVITNSEQVIAARKAVLEFMLKNHPIDCPICDKAGECTLQEYYMRYDLQHSRLSELDTKVKKHKRQEMGPTLVLDSERCILCTRCVRFMREVAGDECLVIAHRRDHAEITTFPGQKVVSPYSLCLTDICPVGAWTNKDFRFKKRVWFLKPVESICPICARGCNTFIDAERGRVYRIRPRRNDAVNKSWMCDHGRLAYKAINEGRLVNPVLKKNGKHFQAEWDEALGRAAQLIREHGEKTAAVISASASLEEAALFKRFSEVVLHAGAPGLHKNSDWTGDNILVLAERNANVRGLAGLGIEAGPAAVLEGKTLVIVLETLYDEPLADLVNPGAQQGRTMIVLSPRISDTVKLAEAAFPAASYAESEGIFINSEGREQHYHAAMEPPGEAKTHREILIALARRLGVNLEE